MKCQSSESFGRLIVYLEFLKCITGKSEAESFPYNFIERPYQFGLLLVDFNSF